MGANGQHVVLAGVVGVAVACERVVAEPEAPASGTLSALLFGGLLLYVGTQTWFLVVTTGDRHSVRWVGCAAIAVVGAIALVLPALLALASACAVLLPLTALVIRHRVTASGEL